MTSFLNGITYVNSKWDSFKTHISTDPEYDKDVYKAIQQFKSLVRKLDTEATQTDPQGRLQRRQGSVTSQETAGRGQSRGRGGGRGR